MEKPFHITSSELQDLTKIIRHYKERLVDTKEIAFNSDDTLKYFYFVLEGRIKISQINFETSKEQTLSILTRGDMFDVVTLLDGKEHLYMATALEPSRLLEVPIEHVRSLIETDQSFNRYFFPYLAQQMRSMEALAVDLSLYDVYQRLIRLIGRNLEKEDLNYELHLINDLSHEELASLVGTVRKVLNRNLQKLKKEGVIDVSRKNLTITDLKRLFEKIEYLS